MISEELTVGLPAPKPLRLEATALFLDLDGTLAPFAARPQDVRPDPRRTRLLERLEPALDGRLAVVSGRTLADVDRILEGRVTAVAAVHGLVRREADGSLSQTPCHPALETVREQCREFARRDPGLIVEDKGLSVTLHYRLAPAHGHAARRWAEEMAATTGLVLQHGDMVEELRTPGPNKGDSVAEFLELPPFAGARPVFLGDDATDEHGFEAVQAHGGVGILIGPGRPTAARRRLLGVEEALAWLEAAL
ncbi:trehalose-phosphatase [Phenylobacterium sp. LjRoot219]|uniref:trehalose-phosphatase n=1 Tax=Phenylobacterium sp. LjRoot219 TaxID=3342283 RepID=UPI003ECDF53B